MITPGKILKPASRRVLDALVKIRFAIIGVSVICLGILLGVLMNSPEMGELFVSILVLFVILIIIVNNPLHGVLIWLFFASFLETWINIPMGAGIPDLEFSRFIAIFLAIFMLARAATGGFRFARSGLVEVCIVATFLGVALAAPLSTDPQDVLQSALTMYMIPLSLYFFAKNLVQDRDDLKKLFLIIAVFGFVLGAYTAYEHATGNVLFVPKNAELHYLVRENGIRETRGIMGNSGTMGRVLAVTIPVTFYLFLEHRKNNARKIMLAGMLIVEFYGIFLTMNRTSWYALLIALFVMQFFYPQFRKIFFTIALIAIVVLWATWDQVNESTVVQERVNEKTEDFNGRTPRWEAGFNMWKVKPIRGWGFGRYGEESGRFRIDGYSWNFEAIENDYLHILVGSGLLGFLPYLLFLLVPLVNSLRLFYRMRASDWSGFAKVEMLAVYWAALLCLLITSYTAVHSRPIAKMITFALTGAVVGSHEFLLRRVGIDRQLSSPGHPGLV